MDWNKLKFTKLENEILEFLFRNPTTNYTGKELAESLKVSQTAISNSAKNLSKTGLINLQKKILLSISLNREEKAIFILKRIFNIKEMHSSGLVDFLSEKFPGANIILFGSYSHGEDTEDSDIDLALIGYHEKQINLDNFERRLKRKIQIHFFKEDKNMNKNLKENIFNGIVLVGGLKL